MEYRKDMEIEPIFKSPKDKNYFFGYYDKSQLDQESKKLLSLEVNFIERMPEKGDVANIGYFDLDKKDQQFVKISSTSVFNWQQGCMLQWLGPDHNKKIIYNDIYKNKYSSVVLDIETKEKIYLPMSIYTVSKKGDFALCIDHERHHFCRRGYSYDGVSNEEKNKPVVSGDGIWRLDIQTKEVKKIIDIEEILKFNPISNMAGSTHYLEHLMLNPSGSRFCFLHRWKMPEGGIYARLYTANNDGSDVYLLNDSGRMSHFCWRNDLQLLAYGGMSNSLNKLRRYKTLVKSLFRPILPIYHMLFSDSGTVAKALTGDSYILFNDRTQRKEKVAPEISDEDGHPSFPSENQNIFITDIYPNLDDQGASFAKLIKYDLSSHNFTILSELRSIPKFDNTGMRCDLHPKCSYDGKYVSVDTMDQGVRSVYLYKVFD